MCLAKIKFTSVIKHGKEEKKKSAPLSGRQSTYIQQVTTGRGRSRSGQVADPQLATYQETSSVVTYRILGSISNSRLPIVHFLRARVIAFLQRSCQLPASWSASRPFSFCRHSIIGYEMMFQKCFVNSWPSNVARLLFDDPPHSSIVFILCQRVVLLDTWYSERISCFFERSNFKAKLRYACPPLIQSLIALYLESNHFMPLTR